MRKNFSISYSVIMMIAVMSSVLFSQAVNAQNVVTTTETTTDQLTPEQKMDFLGGNLNAFVPGFRDANGNFRTQPYVGLSVGADYRTTDSEFAPRFGATVGVETRRFLSGLSFEGTIMRFPETAEQPERHYTSFGGLINVGCKLWQNHNHSNYLAVVGAGGYLRYKSDREDGHLYVSGHGPTFRGGVRGKFAISPRCGFTLEGGWQRLPYQLHPENGTKWGKASYGCLYLKLGIQVNVGRRR